MSGLPDETQAMELPAGCGKFSREALELAAIAKSDRAVPVDERLAPHLVICRRCSEAVERFAADNAFLGEFAKVSARSDRSASGRSVAERAAADGSAAAGGGDLIPGYRLGDEIHRGGQGAVFKAEQLATRRACAVKMLLGGRFASATQRVRFEREVEVVAALRHPSIVTLYESGISRHGEPWFAMELVDGERLDEHVRRLGLGARAVAALLQRVADAIAYAHRRGVIHRDLKPGNILVDHDGVPRVLDFGLARAERPDEQTNPGSGTTLAGEFLGTFAYAAPEQLAGDPAAIDSRCDLYALGVVFYECLTGKRPFDGAKSIGELVIQKTMRTPERPSALAPGIDRDFDVIALRLLASDPSQRYETADALAEDLARSLDGRPILAREDSLTYVVRRNLRRHWIATTAGVVVLATIVVSGIALAVLYANAESARERAENQLDAVLAALEQSNPETGRGTSDMRATEFIGYVEASLEEALADDPADLARLLRTMGLIHLGFEKIDQAAAPIERSYALYKEAFARGEIDALRMADAAYALARLRFIQPAGETKAADYPASEAAYREAIALRESVTGRDDLVTVDLIRQLSIVIRRQKRLEEARGMLDEALLRASRLPATRQREEFDAAALSARGFITAELGDHEQALAEFIAANAAISRVVEPNDFRVGISLRNIAREKLSLGRAESARADAERSVEILRERKGADAPATRAAEALLDEIKSALAKGEREVESAGAAESAGAR
ncbi:MAG: serine/threonine-protein kinase [Planctomycetota bacterium]|nr:serine/threonine-protein kinase [Planctomycetota bacterium]